MLRSSALTTLVFALPLVAQDAYAPKPAEQLARFEQMIGTWEGKGTAVMAPGSPPTEWTATTHARWILDGFFVEASTTVDVGKDTPYVERVIYGWDAENERYGAFSCGNDGLGHVTDLHWLDERTMVRNFAGTMQGHPFLARAVWRFDGDHMKFENGRAIGAGDWAATIDGTFARTDAPAAELPDVSFMGHPPRPELTKLSPMCGDWRVDGWMLMPGSSDKMPVGGAEHTEMILGGHVMHSRTTGDPGPAFRWVGESYATWNAERGCYDLVMFSNMGEFAHQRGWWVDDTHMVGMTAGKAYGMPMVSRGTVEMGEQGPVGWSADTIMGTGEPVRMMEMKYSPAEK